MISIIDFLASPIFFVARGIAIIIDAVRGCLRLFFRDPFIFPFGIYLFFLPFDNALAIGSSGDESPYAIGGYLAILCILALAVHSTRERPRVSPPQVAYWWIALYLLAGLSLLWSIEPQYLLVVKHSGLLLLYLAASTYVPSDLDLKKLKGALLYGGVFGCLFTIVTFLFLGASYRTTGRASIMLGENANDPNNFCFSLAPAIAICFSYLAQAKGRRWFYYLSLLAIFAATILLTRSRGGLVGFLVITLMSLYPRFPYRKGFLVGSVVVFLVLGATCLLSEDFPRLVVDNVSGVMHSFGMKKFNPRVYIWVAGLSAFRNAWLFGVGIDNFMMAFHENKYLVANIYKLPEFMVAHNILLQMAVELGVVGLILLMLTLKKQTDLIRKISVKTEADWLIACVVGGIVQAMFLSILWKKSFWLFGMLIVLYFNWDRQRKTVRSIP